MERDPSTASLPDSAMETLKTALDKRWGPAAAPHVTFHNHSLHLDLKLFLASPEGRKSLDDAIEASGRVPRAPGHPQAPAGPKNRQRPKP